MRINLLLLVFMIFGTTVLAQYSEFSKNPFHERYHDSLKKMTYPYTFPIWGKKAYKKGFDVPYPWGIGANYFWARQEIKIENVKVGFNDRPPVDLSDVIKFGKIEATANAYTVRPDLFVLPFLSVYGVFGFGNSNIDVPVMEPVAFTTHPTSKATSAGMGFTLAGGFQGIVLIFDNSFNWLNTDKLTDLVPAYNSTLRVAKQFISYVRADRNITVWVGPCYQKIRADTKGVIKVSELFPDATSSSKKVTEAQLDNWVSQLSPQQKGVGQDIVDAIKDYFAGLDPGNGTITYELNKNIAAPWNLVIGAQFQLNKNWMWRVEAGAFGQRSQFLLSFNYRFQSLKKKSTQP